jgi:hypothetical protein
MLLITFGTLHTKNIGIWILVMFPRCFSCTILHAFGGDDERVDTLSQPNMAVCLVMLLLVAGLLLPLGPLFLFPIYPINH